MHMDHRLGYPAVLAALYAPEQHTPSLTRSVLHRDAEADIERGAHDKHVTGQLVALVVAAKYAEPAYRPTFDQVRPSANVIPDLVPPQECAQVGSESSATYPNDSQLLAVWHEYSSKIKSAAIAISFLPNGRGGICDIPTIRRAQFIDELRLQ